MDEIINLERKAASNKLMELTKDIGVCMFSTKLKSDVGAITRPMGARHSVTDNYLWFFSNRQSNKNKHIAEDKLVQLYFSDPGKNSYISITGNAELVFDDKQKIEEMWNPLMKTWFQGGKDDPDISLIRVIPAEGYYWDAMGNRFVNFFKMAGSVITGKNLVDSEQGKLKV